MQLSVSLASRKAYATANGLYTERGYSHQRISVECLLYSSAVNTPLLIEPRASERSTFRQGCSTYVEMLKMLKNTCMFYAYK